MALPFRARFSPGDAERLARLVVSTELPGFKLYARRGLDYYYDKYTYKRLKKQWRKRRSNIYVFNHLSLEGEKLVIVRGYGGRSGYGCEETETALLVRLALSPEVSLEHWAVRQEGYGSGSDRT